MKEVEELYGKMLAVFEEKTGFTMDDTADLAVRLYAAAAQIQSLYAYSDWAMNQSFPQTATGEYLDYHAALRGITRKAGTRASGILRFKIDQALEAPGSNVTGTSDYLDTAAVMKLIFAADPDASKIGLLYDAGQDSSTAAIASAKAYLDENGIEYVEHTGSTADEVMLAAQAMVADGVDAVFTPTDNSIMKAELAIYETFIDAGIPQYTGADSFALNGAFLGYGVDYANLGRETADMIADILLNSADPSSTPVRTFDNGTATINTETCAGLGLDFDALSQAFAPYCTKIATLTTAESFS